MLQSGGHVPSSAARGPRLVCRRSEHAESATKCLPWYLWSPDNKIENKQLVVMMSLNLACTLNYGIAFYINMPRYNITKLLKQEAFFFFPSNKIVSFLHLSLLLCGSNLFVKKEEKKCLCKSLHVSWVHRNLKMSWVSYLCISLSMQADTPSSIWKFHWSVSYHHLWDANCLLSCSYQLSQERLAFRWWSQGRMYL